MPHNMGTADRALRAVIGVALLAMAFVGVFTVAWMFWGAIIVGLVMLATAVLGFCPPYAIIGLNTCGTDGNDTSESGS